jgi:tRNA 2-thiouridine synthesizing protein A
LIFFLVCLRKYHSHPVKASHLTQENGPAWISNVNKPLVIDLRGLKCPLPVLKAARRMEPLPAGAAVVVLTTDPMAALDIPHYCQEKGHRLVEQTETDDGLKFTLEKAV